jgi:hypothetical protein
LDLFSEACAAEGDRGEQVALRLANLSAEAAPGGTALEFLPMCGVAALGAVGARAAASRSLVLRELHGRSDDVRFRVRGEVAPALARIGAKMGDALVAEQEEWIQPFFPAAAFLRALATPDWLHAVHKGDAVAVALDGSLQLLAKAPRSAARYPGYKELAATIADCTSVLAARFGVPVFATLETWAATKNPDLRALVERAVAPSQSKGRTSAEARRVQDALTAAAPTRRDPRSYVGPTRERSKGRGAATKATRRRSP